MTHGAWPSSTPLRRRLQASPRVAGHLRWSHQPLPDPRAPRVLATNGSLFFFLPRNREEGRGGEGSGGRRGDSSPPSRRHAAAEPPQPVPRTDTASGRRRLDRARSAVIGVGQAHMHQGTSVMVGCVPVRAAGKRRKLRFATLYKEGAFCARHLEMRPSFVARGFLLLHAKKKPLAQPPGFRYQGFCVVEHAKTRHDALVSGRHHPGKRTVLEAWICLGPLSPAERGISIGSEFRPVGVPVAILRAGCMETCSSSATGAC